MVPPADESRKSTQPEKIPFGVKTESKKVLEPKSNIFDINMQGRRSFTFECEGSFHNPQFYEAIVHFACKLITAPVTGAGGGAAYQQYHIPANDDGEDAADSRYGPVIMPNRFADFFFKKATLTQAMDQETIEKIFNAYSHLGKDKYLGCFCKDQMK